MCGVIAQGIAKARPRRTPPPMSCYTCCVTEYCSSGAWLPRTVTGGGAETGDGPQRRKRLRWPWAGAGARPACEGDPARACARHPCREQQQERERERKQGRVRRWATSIRVGVVVVLLLLFCDCFFWFWFWFCAADLQREAEAVARLRGDSRPRGRASSMPWADQAQRYQSLRASHHTQSPSF